MAVRLLQLLCVQMGGSGGGGSWGVGGRCDGVVLEAIVCVFETR